VVDGLQLKWRRGGYERVSLEKVAFSVDGFVPCGLSGGLYFYEGG